MRYKITFELVNPIRWPQYFRGDSPRMLPADVPDEAWVATEREGEEADVMSQYKGLMTLIERRDYVRNVKVFRCDEPKWEEVAAPV